MPEVSLLVPAQCNTVRLIKSKLVRNLVDKVFVVNLLGEKNGFLKVLLVPNSEFEDKCGDLINNVIETSKEANV